MEKDEKRLFTGKAVYISEFGLALDLRKTDENYSKFINLSLKSKILKTKTRKNENSYPFAYFESDVLTLVLMLRTKKHKTRTNIKN